MLPAMAEVRHAARHWWVLPLLAVAVAVAGGLAAVSLLRPTETVTATAGGGLVSAPPPAPAGSDAADAGGAGAGGADAGATGAAGTGSGDGAASCGGATVPLATVVPTPDRVAVNVHAAGATEPMARQAGIVLAERGFVIGELGGNPSGARVRDRAEIRHGPQGLAGALLLRAYLPGAVLVPVDRPDAVVDLELGAGFAGVAPPAAVQQALAAATCRP